MIGCRGDRKGQQSHSRLHPPQAGSCQSPMSGLGSEPRNWRKRDWGGVRWAGPHPCEFLGFPFWPGVPLPAERVTGVGVAGGDRPQGQLGSPVTSWKEGLGFQGQIWLQPPGSCVTVGLCHCSELGLCDTQHCH